MKTARLLILKLAHILLAIASALRLTNLAAWLSFAGATLAAAFKKERRKRLKKGNGMLLLETREGDSVLVRMCLIQSVHSRQTREGVETYLYMDGHTSPYTLQFTAEEMNRIIKRD